MTRVQWVDPALKGGVKVATNEKIGNVYWFSFPLQAESLRVKRIHMPNYDEALQKDVTGLFFKELKERAMSAQNIVCSIHAPQGQGKSYVGLFIAEKLSAFLGKPVEIDNINFTITDMLKAIEKAEKGSILVLDEQTKTVGPGARAEMSMLYNIEDVVRQYKMYLFFISPRYVHHTYHYMINVWQPGSDKSFDPSRSIEGQWKYSRSIISNESQIDIGYIVTGTPTNKDLLERYEKKKEQFVTDIRMRRGFNRPGYLRNRIFDMLSSNHRINLQEHSHCTGFLVEFAVSKNKEVKKSILDMHFPEQLTTQERTFLVNFADSLLITEFQDQVRQYMPKDAEKKGSLKKRGRPRKKPEFEYDDEEMHPGDKDSGR